jgi:hypothetical protein
MAQGVWLANFLSAMESSVPYFGFRGESVRMNGTEDSLV